jgi:hypothetical protein
MFSQRPWTCYCYLSSLQIAVPVFGRDGHGDVYLMVRNIVIEKSTFLSMFPSPYFYDAQNSLTIFVPTNTSIFFTQLLSPYTSGPNPSTLVQIHVLAYIFTRSVHVPFTSRLATLFPTNPFSSNTFTYHGLNPALLNNTLPPILSERFTARTCVAVSALPGVNQSMLSIRTAMVRLEGCIRTKTSESSSVWMRRLSRADGAERRA